MPFSFATFDTSGRVVVRGADRCPVLQNTVSGFWQHSVCIPLPRSSVDQETLHVLLGLNLWGIMIKSCIVSLLQTWQCVLDKVKLIKECLKLSLSSVITAIWSVRFLPLGRDINNAHTQWHYTPVLIWIGTNFEVILVILTHNEEVLTVNHHTCNWNDYACK